MEKSLGTFFEIGGSGAIECLARGGFDYIIIDAEHGPFSVETVADYIRTAEAAGITPYVRPSGMQRQDILRMLDVGARALIVPFVETVEQVETLVNYAKFAPIGQRGYCPTRTSGWGFDEWAANPAEYMAECNKRALLFPQCETRGAYENIEEIAALEGVDGIFVGPCDLSIALGVPLQMDSPALTEAIEHIFNVCKKYGKRSMIFAVTPHDAKKWFDFGFDSVAYSMDTALLVRACCSAVAECR
jgi:4-hydroxy-2-oxoheptanedioate aldolase